jgi:hypothetical protein
VEDRIQVLIDELDSLVPRTNACVRLMQGHAHLHDSSFVANLAGYRRLGIELLKAPSRPILHGLEINEEEGIPNGADLDADVGYLLADNSDIRFAEFILNEELDIPRHEVRAGAYGGFCIAALGLVAVLIALVLIGLVTVAGWVL